MCHILRGPLPRKGEKGTSERQLFCHDDLFGNIQYIMVIPICVFVVFGLICFDDVLCEPWKIPSSLILRVFFFFFFWPSSYALFPNT